MAFKNREYIKKLFKLLRSVEQHIQKRQEDIVPNEYLTLTRVVLVPITAMFSNLWSRTLCGLWLMPKEVNQSEIQRNVFTSI